MIVKITELSNGYMVEDLGDGGTAGPRTKKYACETMEEVVHRVIQIYGGLVVFSPNKLGKLIEQKTRTDGPRDHGSDRSTGTQRIAGRITR